MMLLAKAHTAETLWMWQKLYWQQQRYTYIYPYVDWKARYENFYVYMKF